jgi:hypothetical protein
MLARSILTAALALGLSSAAHAQQSWPGVTLYDSKGAVIGTAANPLAVTGGTGGGGSANAATTSNATDGQATSTTNQQNVVYNYVFDGTTWSRMRGTGGAVFSLAGQYNATLPTLTSGASSYLAVDSNGRLIQSPGASVTVTTSGLPTGASTAANQATEITALQAIQQRALLFVDFTGQSVATNATQSSAIHDVGVTPLYSRINVTGFASQTGTYILRGCQDSGCAVPFTQATATITVANGANGGYAVMTANLTTRWFQVQYTQGGGATASTVYSNSSFTAN